MNYKTLIKEKEVDFSKLFARMDTDKSLYYLEQFILKDEHNRKVPGVNNLTLNDPRTFADRAIAAIAGADMQVVIEGDGLSDKATTYTEHFLADIFSLADERIAAKGLGSLYQFLSGQSCLRGHIAARCLMRVDGDEFIPDILPCDTRFLTYERDEDGLSWASYKTTRSKAQVQSKYGIGTTKKNAEVQDFWDKEKNIVGVGGREAKTQEHDLGCTPFIIEQVMAGAVLLDNDFVEHNGESIYAADRALYPELNRVATILHTLNMMSFKAPMQKQYKDPNAATRPDLPPYGVGAVIPVAEGELYLPMPIQDIRAATRLLYAMLDARIQRGSLPAVDYGNLTFPLSAVAISSLTESKDQIYLPRFQALALFYRALAKMVIKQYIEGGIDAEIATGGHKAKYSPDKLEGDYSISFKFYNISPEQNIANYSVASAARPYVSEDTIKRDILKLEDPDGEKSKRLSEMADKVVPALALYKMAKAKIEAGEEVEAQLIANQLGLSLDQLKSGKLEQPNATPERETEPALPLLGRRGTGGVIGPGKSSGKRASELETELGAEEGE